MKITIKNLQQQTFTIDFPPAKTIGELKEAIYADRGAEYTIERQKLIYAGIILEDERSVASYNMDEKKFIVVMLKRDIGSLATAPNTTITTTTTTIAKTTATTTQPSKPISEAKDPNISRPEVEQDETTDTGEVTAKNNMKSTATAAATPLAATATRHIAESSLLMGDEYNRSVESLMEMGYSRDMVQRAMSASFNNPERAVEYLISGIPETSESNFMSQAETTSSLPSDTVHVPSNTTTTNASSTAAGIVNVSAAPRENNQSERDDPFLFLRNQPQFLQMRSLVYQNPDLLQAVLRQIGHTNPALLQVISENQDAFLNMLNTPLEGTSGNGSGNQGAGHQHEPSQNRRAQLEAAARAVTGNADRERVTLQAPSRNAEAENNAGLNTISLTLNDRQAIERLKAMGFSADLVLQAYIACERDEQLAANFLISSTFDD